MRPFNAQTIALKEDNNCNLIEASAGTGKTYSIALLILRVIMERSIPVNEILVVTYTNAAVAELQARVRKFLALANEVAFGEEIEQEDISSMVRTAIENFGEQQIRQNLRTALLLMDESNISTIHGFCQMVLNKYAFETKQIFGAQLLTNTDELVEDEVNKFWRNEITTLPLAVLAELDTVALRSELMEVVKNDLKGKKLYLGDEAYLRNMDLELLPNQIKELRTEITEKEKEAATLLIGAEISAITSSLRKNTNLYKKRENFDLWFSEFEKVLHANSEVFKQFPSAFVALAQQIITLKERLASSGPEIKYSLFARCLSAVPKKVKERLKRNNALTFDDLILNLHKVVTNDAGLLIDKVRRDFKAVFIDEFQDTDQVQFQIFKILFFDHPETLSFMIGDPKQSIYAFRGADVDAYLSAKHHVNRQFTMSKNFRSSQQMVEAANTFFLPQENFDTFFYEGVQEGFRYYPVEHTGNQGHMLKERTPLPAIDFFAYNKEEEFKENAANMISQLLTQPYFIKEKDGSKRRIVPADIGVLVRKKSIGRDVKALLQNLNIPSVQILDEKVLNDPIIHDIIALLEAVIHPQKSSIHRALYTNLIAFSAKQIIELDNEKAMEQFKRYLSIWQSGSIYELLTRISTDFALTATLLQSLSMQRTLANFQQLAQLLHQKQVRSGFSPEELLSWIKKNINEDSDEVSEFEQQMESDEDAVKIVTIHKSKGLQYNIVFCIGFTFKSNISTHWSFVDYKDAAHQQRYTPRALATGEIMEQYKRQAEQENRRLMYVAITRAVYKCYVFYSTHQFGQTSLAPFLAALQQNNTFPIFENTIIPQSPYTSSTDALPTVLDWAPEDINIADRHWRKHSFSVLNEHLPNTMWDYESSETSNPYDVFVFEQLGAGAQLGSLIHALFEKIDFNNPGTWARHTSRIFSHLLPEDAKVPHPLLTLLEQVLHAQINTGTETFQLSEIQDAQCVKELQFDFLLQPTQAADLIQILQEHKPVRMSLLHSSVLDGYLNGFIDLFFEHKGKYYLLDWKSNFLGNNVTHYGREQLETAMQQNNYHLQYLLYCMAAVKFLKARLGTAFDYEQHFGGVLYLFIRGMRKGTDSGIYFVKPDQNIIEKAVQISTR